jgi:hypothetical protein
MNITKLHTDSNDYYPKFNTSKEGDSPSDKLMSDKICVKYRSFSALNEFYLLFKVSHLIISSFID